MLFRYLSLRETEARADSKVYSAWVIVDHGERYQGAEEDTRVKVG